MNGNVGKWALSLLTLGLLAACGGEGDSSGKTAAPATPPTPTATDAPGTGSGEIMVYSARQEPLIKPVFDAFTQETGIPVRILTDKEGPLLEKLKAEGANTPADVLMTVDAGNLWQAAQENVLRPIQSETLNGNIPESLRDPEGRWYGLSVRARTLVYNTGKVKPADLSTYEDLASAKWKGRLCLRTSKKVYNQSLVAMMIAEHGAPRTEQIVKGWVGNLATEPHPDDTQVLKAVAAGQCDVGIVNTYYFGRLKKTEPDLPIALFWPNQQGSGVHVNVSGAGVTQHADNPEGGRRLIEWLSSEKAQNMFVDENMEYPANPKVQPSPVIAAWGSFTQNPLNVAKAGELQKEAIALMDRAGYK